MAIQIKRVVCAQCGGEVDRVEFDPDARSPAVEGVMTALGLDEAAATAIVAQHDPAAVLTQAEAADALLAAIVARNVPDRPDDTYACPDACDDAELEITA